MNKYPDRIPYDVRTNSQLSVAKYWWWININSDYYELDYENCRKEIRNWEEYFYPDLVKKNLITNKNIKCNAKDVEKS